MRVSVDLSSFDRLVPKPQREQRRVGTSVQQLHRGAVPQHMRRNTLVLEGWAVLTDLVDIFAQQMLNGIGAEPRARQRREEDVAIFARRLFQPDLQHCDGRLGEW